MQLIFFKKTAVNSSKGKILKILALKGINISRAVGFRNFQTRELHFQDQTEGTAKKKEQGLSSPWKS